MSFLDKLKAIRILKPKTMEFKQTLTTANVTKGKNTCQFINIDL
jgi:hypothetical protein